MTKTEQLLKETLQELFKLFDENILVRNTDNDNDFARFTKEGLRITNTLQKLQEFVDKEIATLEAKMSEQKPESGILGNKETWECPRCGKIHSYLQTSCGCPPNTITSATYIPEQKSVVAPPKTEFKPVKSAEEILKQYYTVTIGKPLIPYDSVIEAMEEYASQFKIDLREELLKYEDWYFSTTTSFINRTTEQIVDEYLKTKK